MCGRTACTLAPDDVCKACSYKGSRSDDSKKGQSQRPVWRNPPGGQQYYPSYNIAPGSHTPVIISSKHYKEELGEITERVIQPMRWGLVPSWHKGDPYKVEYETNNCRAEGMLEKRTYKMPLEKGRRCVVLADGFFEWKRDKSNKQPYFIYFPKPNRTDGADIKIKSESVQIKQEVSSYKQETGMEVKQETENSGIDVKQEPVDEDYKSDGSGYDNSRVKQETMNYGIDTVVKQEPADEDFKSDVQGVAESRVKQEPSVKTERVEGCLKEETSSADNGINTEDSASRLLTMAGVFDVWNPPDGSAPLYSYSIITVSASPAMSWIHHRMPAILTCEEEIEEWLDYGSVPISKAAKLIRPVECVQLHPVSSVVNNSRNKTPDCVKPVDLEKPKKSASSNFMAGWLSKAKKEEKDVNQNEASPSKLLHQNKGSPNKSPKKSAGSSFMEGWLAKAKTGSQNDGPPAKKQKM